MKAIKITFFLLATLHVTAQPPGKLLLLATEQAAGRLILIDPTAKQIVWQWSPQTDSLVPEQEKKWFTNPSEAKASADGRTIYFTCSGGAIGAVDVDNKKLRWYTWSGSNPHSIEPLPDGYIATASSNGNFVKIFSTAGKYGYIDSTAVDRATLITAHNVVWDGKILWSAGSKEIAGWEFIHQHLHELCRRSLPNTDGHDLVQLDDSTLFLSTGRGTWLFRTSSKKFLPYTACVPNKGIKSFSRFGDKIILVYPNESWWSDRVYNCDGSVFYQQDKARFYKVRTYPPAAARAD